MHCLPQLAALRVHVRGFAGMMVHRRGRQLQAWMTAVLRDDLPELHSFVTGLRRDQDAVTAGLTLPHSSGRAEGHINRIIMWNRARQALLVSGLLISAVEGALTGGGAGCRVVAR